jgi:hypothetical protein
MDVTKNSSNFALAAGTEAWRWPLTISKPVVIE